jgi:hypothetical protein
MKKKFMMIVVTATICLFGVAALASPATFLNDVIVSVKNTIFPTETKIQSPPTATEIKYNPTPNVIETKDVPEYILWRVIFSFPSKLEESAEAARQKGEDDSLWTNYFARQAKLSPDNVEVLKNVAVQHDTEIKAVDERLKTLVEQTKQLKQIPSREQFVELQKQKNEITLHYRDNLKAGIGDEAFAEFEKWVKSEFAKGFEKLDKSPLKDQKPDFDETNNNGFTRTSGEAPKPKKPTEKEEEK